MKKAFAIVLLVVIVAASMSIMVACNNNKTLGANFNVPAGGYDGSEVTIKFYHTMGDTLNAVLKTYIAEFNKLYPNIHVEDSQIGKYDDVRDQINTELTAGNQPNLAYCYPDHVALYNVAGAVVQLDNLINSTETVTRADGTTEQLGLTQAQKDDFIEGFYNEGKSFGDEFMYTMPFSKSTEVLYYNKTSLTNTMQRTTQKRIRTPQRPQDSKFRLTGGVILLSVATQTATRVWKKLQDSSKNRFQLHSVRL